MLWGWQRKWLDGNEVATRSINDKVISRNGWRDDEEWTWGLLVLNKKIFSSEPSTVSFRFSTLV